MSLIMSKAARGPIGPHVIAAERIVESVDDDYGAGRVLYSVGDQIPIADAVRLGLVNEAGVPVSEADVPPAPIHATMPRREVRSDTRGRRRGG